jgi:CheY-like chemotaxis protein
MNTTRAKEILIVDDQPNWRKMLKVLLQREGYIVHSADNFEDAQSKLSELSVDLVVLDLRLVDEDIFNVQGLELLQLAKSQKRRPAAVILTGYPESILDETLAKLDVDALMLKVPSRGRFDGQEFVSQIKKMLG